MKKILFKFFILLLLPIVFYFVVSGFYEGAENSSGAAVTVPVPETGDFMNCIFNTGIYPCETTCDWIEDQLDMNRYSGSLHFNTVHLYDIINGLSSGTSIYGTFANDLTSGQITNVNRLLSKTSGLGFLYERCKISVLCYAQRLVYEIKDPGNSNLVNNGFCYQNNYGSYTTDQGRSVLHLVPNTHIENDIASGIYENLQHGDLYGFNLQFADDGLWYVKPMMRIPTGIQGDKEVVRIDIINFSGTTIKSVTIKAENFGANYDGSYKDVFTDVNNEVTGDHTNPNGLNYGQIDQEWGDWETNCQVDFKVHWFGDVEVWFDKMTVDDEFGNVLFAPSPNNFDGIIQNEILASSNNGWNFINFQDEVTYSQLEAIKYVKNFIASHNSPIKLHFASSNYHSVRGFRNDLLGHSVLLDQIQPYEINFDSHELGGLLPYRFINDARFPEHWKSTSEADYNNYLQSRVFGDRNSCTTEEYYFQNGTQYTPPPYGTLVHQITIAKQQIHDYSSSTKLIMQPQIHAFLYYESPNGEFNFGLREPLNEEIEAQAMLSIAHGADGICWFIFN
jgi:hypothetical protein